MHGEIQVLVVTALKSKISSNVSSRFKEIRVADLLPSWPMGPLWLGAIHVGVVTVLQFNIS